MERSFLLCLSLGASSSALERALGVARVRSLILKIPSAQTNLKWSDLRRQLMERSITEELTFMGIVLKKESTLQQRIPTRMGKKMKTRMNLQIIQPCLGTILRTAVCFRLPTTSLNQAYISIRLHGKWQISKNLSNLLVSPAITNISKSFYSFTWMTRPS